MSRRIHTNFPSPTTTKGADVNAERRKKPQSHRTADAASTRTGVFAKLANLLRDQGTSAPSAVRRIALIAAAVALLAAIALPSFASAAEPLGKPWWHLTSGSRPTYLDANAGTNEIQRVTVTGATEGTFVLANMTAEEVANGEYECDNFEPKYVELVFDATPLEVQEGLEGVCGYGSGNVEVTGSVGNYTVVFIGALAGLPVRLLNTEIAGEPININGTISATQLAAGRPDGELYATFLNLGSAAADGSKSPIKITESLPPGLEPIGIVASRPLSEGVNESKSVPCTLETLTCELKEPLVSYDQIEVRVAVEVKPSAQTGELNTVSVSGGGAPPATISRPIVVSTAPVPFGIQTYELTNEEEGGGAATQAGSHPFQSTTTIALNQLGDTEPLENGKNRPSVEPAAQAKDTSFQWPPGMIGNPNPFPQCTDTQFSGLPEGLAQVNACPESTAVGVATVTVYEPKFLHTATFVEPLFNLEPHFGEPARFGFLVTQGESPVYIDTALRSDGDYGITVTSSNITQTVGFLSAQVTVWGVPGDPRHDNSRGWGCLKQTRGEALGGPCASAASAHPPAFLMLPTNCAGPAPTTLLGDSWAEPFPADSLPTLASYTMPGLGGCNRLQFDPLVHAEPTSKAATSPTGLNFDLDFNDEGIEGATNLIQSQLKKAVVTLPQGFTTNPSVAEGLKACTEAQYAAETLNSNPGEGCPNESNIGEVEIESPLVKGHKVKGALYIAKQGENPYGNLVTIYMVAREPEVGAIVKQALKVTPDPVSGQLSTEVDNAPQLPFSHLSIDFRTGQRAPLITPPSCDSNPSEPGNQPFTVQADLYPYSSPATPFHRTSSFQITEGPEGLPCPSGGTPPFHPLLEAGTLNNAAGTYSPFYTRISRKDSEQEITHFSIKLPPGVIGKLAGVSTCSDAAIAAAKALEKEGGGTIEEQSPSCPKNSEVGHSLVGSGVGNVLAYAPGKLYLAGPYHGSNISLVSITAAKVGPFDLGTVVVRFALKIDPETAEVFVDGQGSDPIPHIVDGIPVHLRDVRAYVDRPNFTLNPTSCQKKSTASTVLGSGLNFATEADDQPVTVTSPFQAASCASLGFAPKLALSLKGGTKRGATPAFKAVLTYPKGSYANIAKSVVTLPHSEFLEQGHIKTICTRVQFKEGHVPGEKCPKGSIYGRAEAITPLLDEPLKGPVYLRSSSHNLPDLVAALHNNQVDFALDGRIDSVEGGRIRNTFETVPDAPVSKFVLEMQGGKKGLLVNSTNLCGGTHKSISEFTGQNGKLHNTKPVLKAQCGKKGGKGKQSNSSKGGGSK